jgi:hypothetical protein
MIAREHVTFEHVIGDFNFVVHIPKGCNWEQAKSAVNDIYQEIIRQEQIAISRAQAEQPVPEAAPEAVVPEVVGA